MNLLLCTILAAAGAIPGLCQEDQRAYPRDTSFTLFSAAAKVKVSHPYAVAAGMRESADMWVESGLVYSTATGRPLHVDIFRPRVLSDRLPAILVIHGGGWSSGDRRMEAPLAQRLAAHGFVTAAVEYRLSPEAKYPAALRDLKTAIRWLRAQAAKYGIDTLRIAACGGSAGGNLAASLGLGRNGPPEIEGVEWQGHSSRIQAVVDIDGPLDLTIAEERMKADDPSKPSAVRRWLGFSYEERPDLWREVSPVFNVTSACAPVVFINSSLDRFHAGRDRMIAELKEFGIATEVHTFPDTPHPFWLFEPWAGSTSDLAARFLLRVFRGGEGKDTPGDSVR